MSINGKTNTSPLIEWGVAGQALAGETESGDQCLVELFPNGALAAVVDGLGHGAKAANVAKTATATLKEYAREPVTSLLNRCHQKLRGSRGVVMSLASFNALKGTMTWLGIGNVEGALLRADAKSTSLYESLLLRGGVVGYRMPKPRVVTLPVKRGDTLIFVTDGIRSDFIKRQIRENPSSQPLDKTEPPQQIADYAFTQYSQGTDDALVLVVRYVGEAS